MSSSAAASPRVVYVPAGQVQAGAVGLAEQAAAQQQQQQAAAQAQQPAPAAAAPAAEAPAQAAQGQSLLGRVLGIMPLAAGVLQGVLGFLITNGTVSLASVPLLGSIPAFIVGGLVAATAVPTAIQGIQRILGRI